MDDKIYLNVTRYFHRALKSQKNPRIEFKDKFFIKVTQEEIKSGILGSEKVKKFFDRVNKKVSSKGKYSTRNLQILIALKTINKTIDYTVKNSTGIDDLTGLFFLSAILTENGELCPLDKDPWFVREFLEPMVAPELSIGSVSDVDKFLMDNVARKNQINSWKENFEYVCDMYEYVTGIKLSQNKIKNLENVVVDNNCYIFYDDTIFAAKNICELYDHIEKEQPKIPLYEQFLLTVPPDVLNLVTNSEQKMKCHCGQMGGDYPLSPSQRESLNNLSELEDGGILAVSGPPGTGKTTLLQSVVANLLTQYAINESEPPIIVASSTNNQAVTNIIDSFGNINRKGIANLEKRWVSVVDSFAVYFPSESKKGKVKEKYQVNNDLLEKINNPKNVDDSFKCMFKECEEYFGVKFTNIDECSKRIHNELFYIDKLRQNLLNEYSKIMENTQGKSVREYIETLEQEIDNISARKNDYEEISNDIRETIERVNSRTEEWKIGYRNLPWYLRWFPNFLPFKEIISHWIETFSNYNEFEKVQTITNLDMVLQCYNEYMQSDKEREYEIRNEIIKLEDSISYRKEKILEIKILFKNFEKIIIDLKKYKINLNAENILEYNLNKLNDLLDTSVRYIEFWLAVHYYECSWLKSKKLTEKQLDKNIKDIVIEKIKSLSMLCPCMVMTFYMLPNQFKVYMQNERVSTYLYNHIDLLIIDEAGQISPEIATPSFALAKRAIVVGDEQQIPPVWGTTSKALDIALAIENKVINDIESFVSLEEMGLNTSQSSVMKLASSSCLYNRHSGCEYERSLFLCEHRRCYNEIIDYCNNLVYGGKLLPLRGRGKEDTKRPIDNNCYPVIGYYNIESEKSEKIGSSRINRKEAEYIVEWLEKHFTELYNAYNTKKDILAIITPFKQQANIIREELKKKMGEDLKYIDVGTVHTFQGAERKIIIFSTTYGKSENCYFINNNDNLMNVAVSRAKDAFWVFGCYECLINNGNDNSASGLLAKYIKDNEIKL